MASACSPGGGASSPARPDAALDEGLADLCRDDRYLGETPTLTAGRLEALRLCPDQPEDVFQLPASPGEIVEIRLVASAGAVTARAGSGGQAEAEAGGWARLRLGPADEAAEIRVTSAEIAAEGLPYSLEVAIVAVADQCLPDDLSGDQTPLAVGERAVGSLCGDEVDRFTVEGRPDQRLLLEVESERGGGIQVEAWWGPADDPMAERQTAVVEAGQGGSLSLDLEADEVGTITARPLGPDVLAYSAQLSAVDRPVDEVSHSVRGSLTWVDRPVTPEGLEPPAAIQAAGAVLDVVDEGGALVAEAVADEAGDFELSWRGPAAGAVEIRARAEGVWAGGRISAVPESLDIPWALSLATLELATLGPDAPLTGLALAVPVDDPLAGAFHIVESARRALSAAAEILDVSGAAPVVIRWRPGEAAACGTCFSPGARPFIELGGLPRDPDEWDDSVIAHEIGHYVAHEFAVDDSPGGAHDGSPVDPRLAWSEGFAHFYAAWSAEDPALLDLKATGVSVTDLEQMALAVAYGSVDGTLSGDLSEWLVGALLWDLHDEGEEPADEDAVSVGPSAILLSAVERLPGLASDRGGPGVDLADHLDALICAGASTEGWAPLIAARRWPYSPMPCAEEKSQPPIAARPLPGGGWQIESLDPAASLWVGGQERGATARLRPDELPKAGWLDVRIQRPGQLEVRSLPIGPARRAPLRWRRRAGAAEPDR